MGESLWSLYVVISCACSTHVGVSICIPFQVLHLHLSHHCHSSRILSLSFSQPVSFVQQESSCQAFCLGMAFLSLSWGLDFLNNIEFADIWKDIVSIIIDALMFWFPFPPPATTPFTKRGKNNQVRTYGVGNQEFSGET